MTSAQLIHKVVKDLNINLPESVPNQAATDQVTTEAINQSTQNKNVSAVISNLISKHTSNTNSNQLNTMESELHSFGGESESDTLNFWKKNAKKYPKLSAIATVILGIPISNAKAEGAFSISGCLIKDKRASIDPLRAEKVLFIHDNYHLLELR